MNQAQRQAFETVNTCVNYISETRGLGRSVWPMEPKLEPLDENVPELFKRVQWHVDRAVNPDGGASAYHGSMEALAQHTAALRKALEEPAAERCAFCHQTLPPEAQAPRVVVPMPPRRTAGVTTSNVDTIFRLATLQAGLGLHRPPVVPKPSPLPDGSYSDDEIRPLVMAATEIVKLSNPGLGTYYAVVVAALKQLASEAPHLFPPPQQHIRVSDPIIVQARERELAEAAAVADAAEAEAAPKPKKKAG
jgi:hypothetical protein